MELKFFYPRWGSADMEWSVFLDRVKKNGYHGVEINLPLEKQDKKEICSILSDLELDFIGQHSETKEVDFKKHKEKYRAHLYNLTEANPMSVNTHTGMDFFSFGQNVELIELAEKIEQETGVPITHETHRSRFAFAAHICYKYLEELPFLKLTADLSHWCCVAESMLENQENAVKKAIENTYHIHARVGSPQGPQVIDPRDSNYSDELAQFNTWWSAMIENASEKNRSFIAITPEYGPFPYGLYHKNTTKTLEDQWEINAFIKNEVSREWDSLK